MKLVFSPKFSYNGTSISLAQTARYSHWGASLGRFGNRPMVVGGSGNKKVERRAGNTWAANWDRLDDFPFVTHYIEFYSMINFNEHLYLFGLFLFNQQLAIFNLLSNLINNIYLRRSRR